MSKEPSTPKLSDEQVKFVEENYFLNIVELTRGAFKDETLTQRDQPKIRAVKQALAHLGKHVNPVPTKKDQELLDELTDDQKLYIRNNYKNCSGPLEIARTLFANPKLEGFSKQCQMVATYCRQLDPKFNRDDELVDDRDYKPPINTIHLMGKVNKYALNPNADRKVLFDPATMTASQTHQLDALLSYMKLPLFKVEADKFVKRIDRDVFESTFIAMCWDKTDLSAEHVIQFIHLSSLIVKGNQLDRIAQKLDDRQNETLSDPDATIKMTEVETLNAYREKINAGSKQIAALIKSLTGERNKITDEKRAGNSSMHNLVESWKKREDRMKIIQLAERQQKAALKQEIERLSSMDAVKLEIFGISKSDIVK